MLQRRSSPIECSSSPRFSFTGSSVDAIGHVSDCNEDGDEEEDSFDDDDSDGYDNDAVKVDVTTSDVV